MADKDQAKVWSEGRKAQSVVVGGAVPLSSTETVQVEATSSYARVMDNKAVQKQVDSVAQPIENSYRSLIKQLRDQNAVGVVVATDNVAKPSAWRMANKWDTACRLRVRSLSARCFGTAIDSPIPI